MGLSIYYRFLCAAIYADHVDACRQIDAQRGGAKLSAMQGASVGSPYTYGSAGLAAYADVAFGASHSGFCAASVHRASAV